MVYLIENAEKWHGPFEHPWFYESTYRKLMEDYSERYVHIQSTKTGIIFQFRLYYYTHYGYRADGSPNCILLTSTNGDTFFLPRHGDIQKAFLQILKSGTPVSSKTSFTGKVCFGQKFSNCWTHLQSTLNACDMEIKPQSIKLIWKELETRQEYFEGGLL